MSAIAVVAIIASTVYAGLAVWALAVAGQQRRGRLFAVICAVFAIWSFTFGLWTEAGSQQAADRLHQFGSLGWTLGPLYITLFFLELTETPIPRRRIVLPLLHLPALALLFGCISGTVKITDSVWTSAGWRESFDAHPVGHLLFTVYYVGYVSLGMFLLIRWGWSHRSKARRRVTRLIAASAIVSLSGAALCNQFLPWLGVQAVPPIAALAMLPWTLAMAHASARYRNAVLDQAGLAEDVISAVPLGIVTLDLDGITRRVNEAAAELLCLKPAVLLSARLADVLPRASLPTPRTHRRHTDLTRLQWRQEIERHRSDGRTVRIEVHTSPLRDRDGDHVGYLVTLRDVTAERAAQHQLHHMATHDALTGLPNRRLFEERVQLAAARARRHKRLFAVMLLDLDGFKQINDDLGHDVGDEVLCSVADLLQRNVRDCDTVARMGGDEFLVLLDELHDLEGAEIAAERLLAAFDAMPPIEPGGYRVSASIGSAAYPWDATDVEGLFRRADDAMYASKACGGAMHTYCQRVGERTGKIVELIRDRG